MLKVVRDGGVPPPDRDFHAVPLGPAQAEQAVMLAALTQPGPFGPRTSELGEYLGVFADDALMAMAGECMQAGKLPEVSGLCTHPSFQGRGLARRLMHELLRRELRRGEMPFLHVMRGNAGARSLYRRMGFRDHGEVGVRVVARP